MCKSVSNRETLEYEKCAAKEEERYNNLMGYTYTRGSDKIRCGNLVRDMSNDYDLI